MIYTEENKIGEIAINKSVIQDIIVESIRPWVYTGKLRVISSNGCNVTDKGLLINLHFSVAIGESAKEIFLGVSNEIANAVTNSLEFELDDIVLTIDSMFTKKGSLIERNIVFSYNANKQ